MQLVRLVDDKNPLWAPVGPLAATENQEVTLMTSTDTAPSACRPRPHANWTLLRGVPGVLYAMAALMFVTMTVSGAAAPATHVAAPATSQPGPSLAHHLEDVAWTTVAQPKAAPEAALKETSAVDAAVSQTMPEWPSHHTGDRLTADEIDTMRAAVAAYQATGEHRGPGVIESWSLA